MPEAFADAGQDTESYAFREYDITSSPNDFNVATIYDFITSGNVRIPLFQRNYVWDIKAASKLIESIIIGLPIPQIFLFEESRNNFLVIDGQQRLMSIYYFMKQRFPLKSKRVELRRIYDREGEVPEEILHDAAYFAEFRLSLPEQRGNPLNGRNYSTLGEYKTTFNLRKIRNVIIKQNLPSEEDDSSKYEIFNRLNSGGVNLWSQEIRASLYHSLFYSMLYRINMDPRWRALIGVAEADLHMRDVETLLRGFALLAFGSDYRPSMTGFLNTASRRFKKLNANDVAYFESLFVSFLDSCCNLPSRPFHGKGGTFTISIYDAVFPAVCKRAYLANATTVRNIDPAKLQMLKDNPEFFEASQSRTAGQGNVRKRLEKAMEMLGQS